MTRIHKYEIRRALGSGGMGTVYLARDPELERQVAIKVLNRFTDPELLARFIREGRAAAALRHVNIVTIYDVGQQDQQPFIAMEYVAGTPLSELIGNRPPLSIAARIGLIEQVCAGLQFAHRSGIIHRDIKPANVIVDTDGVIRIVDFGIARISGSGMTEDGALIGTLNYMSPEQLLGDPVDHRSDIFAVGALAYELIGYQQAFPGTIGDGLLHRLTALAPKDIDTLLPGLDPGIAGIIGRALQKRPEERYGDLGEMRDALSVVRQRLESAGDSPFEPAGSRVLAALPAPPSVSRPERDQGSFSGLRRTVALGILVAIVGTGLATGLLLRARRAEIARTALTETAGSSPSIPAAPVSAPPPAPAATSVASTSMNDPDLDSVRRIIESGDLPAAMSRLRGLSGRRADAGFRSLAEQAARQALGRMEGAHRTAANAGAEQLSPAAFAEARAESEVATRAMARRQFLDAGERSLEAAGRFERAAALALALPARGAQPPAPSTAPASTNATPPSSPSDAAPPVIPPPAISANAKAPPVPVATGFGIPGIPAVTPEPARVSAPPPAASAVEREQPLIQQTLAKYRAAFRDYSIDALVAVYPGVPREERQKLERAFKESSKNCRSYEVLQGDPAIFVTGAEASVAQVTVQSSYSCTPTTGQRDQVASMRDVFEMKKVNGAWVIARMGSFR